MDTIQALVATRAENEMLREQVAQLQALLSDESLVPHVFRLSRSEGVVFGSLMKREFATASMLMAALYRSIGKDSASQKNLEVFLFRIRRKIAPFGIAIKNRWNQGWFIEPAEKVIIRAMLASQREAAQEQAALQ